MRVVYEVALASSPASLRRHDWSDAAYLAAGLHPARFEAFREHRIPPQRALMLRSLPVAALGPVAASLSWSDLQFAVRPYRRTTVVDATALFALSRADSAGYLAWVRETTISFADVAVLLRLGIPRSLAQQWQDRLPVMQQHLRLARLLNQGLSLSAVSGGPAFDGAGWVRYALTHRVYADADAYVRGTFLGENTASLLRAGYGPQEADDLRVHEQIHQGGLDVLAALRADP